MVIAVQTLRRLRQLVDARAKELRFGRYFVGRQRGTRVPCAGPDQSQEGRQADLSAKVGLATWLREALEDEPVGPHRTGPLRQVAAHFKRQSSSPSILYMFQNQISLNRAQRKVSRPTRFSAAAAICLP